MTNREKGLLGFLAFLIAVGAYVLLFFMPVTDEIGIIEANIVTLTTEVEEAQLRQVEMVALNAEIEDLRQRIDEALLIPEGEETQLNILEHFDFRAHLRIVQAVVEPYFAPGSPLTTAFAQRQLAENLYVYNINLTFDTTYSGILQIIQNFAFVSSDFRIAEYDISQSAPEEGQQHGEFSISISLEYLVWNRPQLEEIE